MSSVIGKKRGRCSQSDADSSDSDDDGANPCSQGANLSDFPKTRVATVPSPLLHGSDHGANEGEHMEDIFEQDEDDSPNSSQPEIRGMQEQRESEQGEFIPLAGCSREQSRSFQTISSALRNEGVKHFQFPMDVYKDANDLLTPAKAHFSTMAAVSKAFKMLPLEDPSRLTQPTEGTPLTFVSECTGPEIPKPSMRVMYFAQRLRQNIESTGLQGYVVPTDILTPQFDLSGKRIICMMESRRVDEEAEGGISPPVDSDPSTFSLVEMLYRREGNQTFSEDVPKQAFTVRVGFTCAYSQTKNKELEKRIFCVVFLTPLNSFDFLTYIKQNLLTPPSRGCSDFDARNRDYNDMQFLWRLILEHEAFHSMCLPGHMGDPVNEPPSGRLGLYSITNEFTIPLKINAMIRMASRGSEDVQIPGFPFLSFKRNDEMDHYRDYVDAHINEVRTPALSSHRPLGSLPH